MFPNCKWNSQEFLLDTSLSILTVIASIAPPQMSGVDMHSTAHVIDCGIKFETSLLDPHQYEERLKTFRNTVISSDEIAYLLVQIMSKCVANECEDNLNSQSVSMISLNFALECLCCDDVVYATKQNANTIKLELLQLTISCINNIFNITSSISVLQFQFIFTMLAVIMKKHAIEITEIKCESGLCSPLDFSLEFLSATNYVFFYTLQNIIMRPNKLKELNIISVNKSNLNDLKFIDEKVIDISIKIFQQVLEKMKIVADANPDARLLLELTFRTLIKINEQLFKDDQLIKTNVNYSNSGNKRGRCHYLRQMHCHTQVPTLNCFFQSTLLNLLPKITVDMQEDAVRYLLRIGICCCHYTINTYASCLNMISHLPPLYQNCTYKFLHRRILYTIFSHDHGLYNKRSTENCAKCDTKLKSLEFRKDILQLYKQLHDELNTADCSDSKVTTLQLLLKHLKNISDTLSSDMAAGILAEIILPTFRKFKEEMLQSRKSNKTCKTKSTTADIREPTNNTSHINISFPESENCATDGALTTLSILQDCLNIFVAYLGGDIRLIKAFYNEENISHLEDLFYEPPLVHSICELIKIGIDNVTFLGESNQEQIILSRRLTNLLLNSGAYNAFQFNALMFNQQTVTEVSDAEKLEEATGTINALSILYITALKWSFIHELLQTSQCFFNALTTMYNLNKIITLPVEPDDSQTQSTNMKNFVTCELNDEKTIGDILTLNYNALSTFLQLSQCKSSNISTKPTYSPQHTNTYPSSPMQDAYHNTINPEANKEDCCLSSSLEYFLSSIEVDSVQQKFGSISSSIASYASTIDAFIATSDAHPCFTNNNHSFNTNAQTSCYTDTCNLSFLDKLKNQNSKYSADLQSVDSEINENVVIFDVRNHQSSCVAQNTLHATTTTLNTVSVDALIPTSIWNCAADALSTSMIVAGPETNAAALSIGISIFSKFFSVLGSFFGGSQTSSLTDLNNSTTSLDQVIDSNLICLIENSSDSKRYLLSLFETTMAISIKSLKDEGGM